MRIADFQAGAAAVHALQGDDESALSYYDLSLPALVAQGNPYHVAGSLLGKAELLFRRGEWAESRSLCEQAASLAEEAHLSEYQFRARVLAARLDHAGGSPDTGLERLAELIEETQEKPEQAALHYEIWQLTGDRSAGKAALTGYRDTARQSPSYINKRRLVELEAYFEA
jgi:ATP/maltotriose-dependent transcriptional regulator MalT